MRVGWDLDGCLYDFGDSVLRYLKSIGMDYAHKDNAQEPHSWNFFEHWGMSREDFAKHVNAGADAGYVFCGLTRPNAVEAVWAVKNAGHEIIIITDRQFGSTPEVSHNNTKRWWKENGFPDYDEIHFSADKTCVPTDIFVEDKAENHAALLAVGTPCYLISRPWNADYKAGTWRINDVSDYPEKVASLAAGKLMVLQSA